MDTDRFEHGQWIKGRVYERRCDISADGSLFLAFVRQSGGPVQEPAAADTWLALSRPPWFSALAVWFIGGTYHTGGFFPDGASVWLGSQDAHPDIGEPPSWLKLTSPRGIAYVDGTPEWTDRTVHFNRLLRDGWLKLEDALYRTEWEHRHPAEDRTLVMVEQFQDFQTYGGPYRVDYSVRLGDRADQPLGRATWADWDHGGRLVVAREGRLEAWNEANGFEVVADFNDQAPDPQPAPDWAKEWPRQP
jgi:hypothetical protein